MKKSELVDAVAAETGLTKADSTKAIEAVFSTISGALAKGIKVPVAGFGGAPPCRRGGHPHPLQRRQPAPGSHRPGFHAVPFPRRTGKRSCPSRGAFQVPFDPLPALPGLHPRRLQPSCRGTQAGGRVRRRADGNQHGPRVLGLRDHSFHHGRCRRGNHSAPGRGSGTGHRDPVCLGP